MKKYNIDAEDLIRFFVNSGATHRKGTGGFSVNGKMIDPVEEFRIAFQTPIENNAVSDLILDTIYVTAINQVYVTEEQKEYPVLDDLNWVA